MLAWVCGAVLFVTAMDICAEAVTFDVAIRSDGTDKPRTLRAKKGDRITILWSTDQPLVVHIHPFEVEQDVVPGKTALSEFAADISGRFPIEVHILGKRARHKVVGYLEVLPP
jgi:hypothetical protein